MTATLTFVVAFVAGALLTRVIRGYALRAALLDIPNHRSSHTVPVPRGGGLAICLVVCAAALWLTLTGAITAGFGAASIGGGVVIAGVGWLDDRYGLRPHGRALAHALAAAGALACLGGLTVVRLGNGEVHLGPAGTALALIGIVWLINLYNFMDGTDGIAGVQAVLGASIGGGLLLLANQPGLAAFALAIAGSSAGFLVWNWHPARIFMGDVGSGFLGYQFALLAIGSERAAAVPLVSWLMLLGVFVFDATATLLRRALAGERWYEPHRSHAYQRVTQAGMSHGTLGLVVGGMVAMLGIAAFVAWRWPDRLPIAGGGALLLLAAAYALVEWWRPMRYARVSAESTGRQSR